MANPYGITEVDVGGALGRISALENNALARKYQMAQMGSLEADSKRKSALATAVPNALSGDEKAMQTVAGLDPEMFLKLDERQREMAKENTEKVANLIFMAKQNPDRWGEIRQSAIEMGMNPANIPESYDEGFIDQQAAQVLSIADQLKMMEPASAEGKVQSDVNRGILTPEQGRIATATADYEMIRDADGNPVAQRDRATGKIEALPDSYDIDDPDDTFDKATKLRGEYIKGSGDFVKVRDSYNRIEASASDPSAAGDLALIFNYMKVLDPGSTVREGEFATAQNSGSVPSRVFNLYNRVLSGERLAPEQRDDFVSRAGKLYESQKTNQESLVSEYRRLAERSDIAPEDVIVDFMPKRSGQKSGVPEVTTAEDYNALPSGTQYRDPQGNLRTKR